MRWFVMSTEHSRAALLTFPRIKIPLYTTGGIASATTPQRPRAASATKREIELTAGQARCARSRVAAVGRCAGILATRARVLSCVCSDV